MDLNNNVRHNLFQKNTHNQAISTTKNCVDNEKGLLTSAFIVGTSSLLSQIL